MQGISLSAQQADDTQADGVGAAWSPCGKDAALHILKERLDHKTWTGRPVETENQIDVRKAFKVAQALGVLRENLDTACAVGGITGLDRCLFGHAMRAVNNADRCKVDAGWEHV